ncbi:hypothetical protein COMA2_20485 [Candidatus Nitrospira nitrificans]|uniref:Uncharacterized protein n=1 Tax=Candidatus Nitrospira nitrificans TaxID=1742973 RepID=A0A0S4LH14_9BACT|nr:hypothetical protein COMA2_20485 [Candidatus Nitrospira nitrificans]
MITLFHDPLALRLFWRSDDSGGTRSVLCIESMAGLPIRFVSFFRNVFCLSHLDPSVSPSEQ